MIANTTREEPTPAGPNLETCPRGVELLREVTAATFSEYAEELLPIVRRIPASERDRLKSQLTHRQYMALISYAADNVAMAFLRTPHSEVELGDMYELPNGTKWVEMRGMYYAVSKYYGMRVGVLDANTLSSNDACFYMPDGSIRLVTNLRLHTTKPYYTRSEQTDVVWRHLVILRPGELSRTYDTMAGNTFSVPCPAGSVSGESIGVRDILDRDARDATALRVARGILNVIKEY